MSARETEDLIRELSRDAARGGAPARLNVVLPLALLAGLVVAITLAFSLFDAGQDLSRTLGNGWFYLKLGCMTAVGGGAWIVLADLARPERGRIRFGTLLPAILLLGLGALTDTSALAWRGAADFSVPNCVGSILLLALPVLALTLTALRSFAATTRPTLAGAATGLLSGALGGAAYALACRNDGGLFIAIWYGAAVIASAALGAMLGRRLLAW